MLARRNPTTYISIELSCQKAFEHINQLIKNRVVNKDLAFSTQHCFIKSYNQWEKRWNGMRPTIAKSWLVFFTFCMLTLRETTKEKSNYFSPILLTAYMACMVQIYQHYFGSMPFESIGTKLLLNKNDSDLCDNKRKFNMTCLQAQRVSPYHSLRFFNPNPLDKALTFNQMDYFEYNAIMRGLFGLQNSSFDCVSISALVMLALIEQQIPFTIMRIKPANPSVYSHHYVIVNLSPQSKLRDVTTWNDDTILVDPWYGICTSAKEIKGDRDFFNRYPLLLPGDKVISCSIQGNTNSPSYLFALNLFKQLREKHAIQPEYSPSYAEMIYPRIRLSS